MRPKTPEEILEQIRTSGVVWAITFNNRLSKFLVKFVGHQAYCKEVGCSEWSIKDINNLLNDIYNCDVCERWVEHTNSLVVSSTEKQATISIKDHPSVSIDVKVGSNGKRLIVTGARGVLGTFDGKPAVYFEEV